MTFAGRQPHRSDSRSRVFQCYFEGADERVLRNVRSIETILLGRDIKTCLFSNDAQSSTGIRPLDSLSHHDDYVLIVHNPAEASSASFARIASLSAPIILFNYTKFEAGPSSNRLAYWKALASAGLGADSLATLELRSAGLPESLTLKIAPDHPLTPAPVRSESTGPFTVVVPGDVTGTSPTSLVLDSFLQLRRQSGLQVKLVLLGRTLDAAKTKLVQDWIDRHDLAGFVDITGSMDEASRGRTLSRADVCLLLDDTTLSADLLSVVIESRVPILAPSTPAMSCFVAPTAFPAMAHVDRAEIVRALMSMVSDPAARTRLASAQYEHYFSVEIDPELILWNALGRCGVSLHDRDQSAQLRDQVGFVVAGHFSGSYSLAAVNRLLAVSLERRRLGSVKVLPVFYEPTPTLDGVPPDEASGLMPLFERARPLGTPTIVISQHYPPWIPTIANDLAVALFAWEESLIPTEIIRTLNTGFGGVLAISTIVEKALVESGIAIPVHVTGQAIDLAPFLQLGHSRSEKEPDSTDMVFLHVSSCFPRKGVDLLLAAWAIAFTKADPVRLIIKGFDNIHNTVDEQVARLRDAHPDLAPIDVIAEDLSQAGLLHLFAQAHRMVLPTRAEGFNMVAAEAMAAGLPLIVTGYGGHRDFLGPDTARLLDFSFAPSTSHVSSPGSVWVEPALDDLVAALREALADHRTGGTAGRERATRAMAVAAVQFDPAAWADRTAAAAAEVFLRAPSPLRRVAWISTWGVRCGIAEYSKALLEHRPTRSGTREKAPDILVLCDLRTNAATSVPDYEGVEICPVWSLGSQAISAQIARKFIQFEPQALVIQHQAGIVGWQDLVEIVDLALSIGARVLVTLHSTTSIGVLDGDLRRSLLDSLAAADRVIVHTLRDLETLRRHGLTQNVALLAHGTAGLPDDPAQAPPRTRQADEPLIGCYGFLFAHKGISTLIEAFAGLRRQFPGARLRLVNAVFPAASSEAELLTCRVLAKRLGIDDAIEWHTRYLDENSSRGLLAACDLVVMPYGETPESASGAVRVAIASGAPVAVSKIAIFDELDGAVLRVNARSPATLGADLERILHSDVLRRSPLGDAKTWLQAHDWSVISGRLLGMVDGIFQQGRRDVGKAPDFARADAYVLPPKVTLKVGDVWTRNLGDPRTNTGLDKSEWSNGEGTSRWTIAEVSRITLPSCEDGLLNIVVDLANFLPIDKDVTLSCGSRTMIAKVPAGTASRPVRFLRSTGKAIVLSARITRISDVIPDCGDGRSVGIAVGTVQVTAIPSDGRS